MRANRDARLARQPHGPPHDGGVAGVKAAGDVGGRNASPSARHPRQCVKRAERLAEIAVQVDMAHTDSALSYQLVRLLQFSGFQRYAVFAPKAEATFASGACGCLRTHAKRAQRTIPARLGVAAETSTPRGRSEL